MELGALTVAVAIVAGIGVRLVGRTDRTRSLWWVAAVTAGMGSVVASGGPVPLAAAVAAPGLAIAGGVDAVEGRIPTAVAHATTGLSLLTLVAHGLDSGEWGMVARAVGLTALLVVAFAGVWLAGGMGFGDVRLAGATVTAMAGGVAGLMALLWGSFAVAGIVVLGRRLAGASRGSGRGDDDGSNGGDGDSGRIPFGPALVAGWIFSVWTA